LALRERADVLLANDRRHFADGRLYDASGSNLPTNLEEMLGNLFRNVFVARECDENMVDSV